MKTWHLHIEGQVQGVGFRPYVYRLARLAGLSGWVINSVDGVHIEFNAPEKDAEAFTEKLLREAPPLSNVSDISLTQTAFQHFDDFQIRHSDAHGTPKLLLTPDFAICPDCRREIHDPQNRRYGYPFITCIHCGPRFSIIRQLPYDRPRTAMAPYPMCADCEEEYEYPGDRRYYSQTNSCPSCSIRYGLLDLETGNWYRNEDARESLLDLWDSGQIVAVKGIGGYLLTCDATQEKAVHEIRSRKKRPEKPLAVMYPDLQRLQMDVRLTAKMETWLTGPASPIVLAPIRTKGEIKIALDAIAPNLGELGVMIPYAPHMEWMLSAYGKPIVATSANPSGRPIVFHEEEWKDTLAPLADAIFVHDRAILVPQDDSVVRMAPDSKTPIVIRRSRGYAPTLHLPKIDWGKHTALAMGAMLKSTFALLHQGHTYVSPYLGSLEDFDTQTSYRHSLQHMLRVMESRPSCILVDQHPGYPSTDLGYELARQLGVQTRAVQHHQAHFGAVLAEHDLLDSDEPVLGVIWDGTGLGSDGQIWGGEFFKFEGSQMQRVAHLAYYPQLLGDKMAREPRLSALAVCAEHTDALAHLEPAFDDRSYKLYLALLDKDAPLLCSSMGRLFDAVSALLGIKHFNSFEGEAAMLLEAAARDWICQHPDDLIDAYPTPAISSNGCAYNELIEVLMKDIVAGEEVGRMAFRFHASLARWAVQMAEVAGCRKLAFSGGVFQNALLVDLIHRCASEDMQLFFHRDLSPNDECVSFGQLVLDHLAKRQDNPSKPQQHVLSNTRKDQDHTAAV